MDLVLYAAAIAAGLFVGGFLNVVIYRGPSLWGLSEEERARGALYAPRSYCPDCTAPIRAYDLIPLVSYVVLRGKCRVCGAAISPRYPIVEFAGAVAAGVSIAVYGLTISALLAAAFLMALIALAAIDAETGYLPDPITAPLVWLGLIANLTGRFATIEAAVIGAVAGYAAFWLVAAAYKLVRKREGLGGGDAKLLAAIGAWGGWSVLAPAVFLGAVVALAGVLAARATGRKLTAETPVPFGPALCLGGAAVFLAAGLGLFPALA